MHLEQLIDEITATPLYLRLKTIVEHAEGWHDREPVFDHSMKTAAVAKRECEGEFITNAEAKKLFRQWVEEELFGMQRKDILVLVALLHDCGKILHYKEHDEIKPLITIMPQSSHQTICPGHEYWGGHIVVKEMLKDIPISTELKAHIATLVKLHGVFQSFFSGKEAWTLEEIIAFAKSYAEGFYKESLFNAYCDGYTASAFAEYKKKIEEMFNTPSFYTPRTYFIG